MKRLIALLVLLASPAWAAMNFNGTTEFAESSSIELATIPFTVCGWGKSSSDTTAQVVWTATRGTGSSTDNSFALQFGGATAGDPIRAAVQNTASSVADSTTGYTANAWHHGCATFATADTRHAFINGGSKGSNTALREPVLLDRVSIGGRRISDGSLIQFFSGDIAEVGIWRVVLSDREIATLGAGFVPPCVRKESLDVYYPMVRDVTSIKDIFTTNGNNLTLTGGTVSDHPRIYNCN